MREENPGDGVGGIIGLITYITFLIVNFIIEHIWWVIGGIAAALIIFLFIKCLKKINLDKEIIWGWLVKNKKPLLYLVGSGAVLVIFRGSFWLVFVILCNVWILLYTVNHLIKKFFGCRVCDTTGRLSGYNINLGMEFDNDICYACGGRHLVFKDESDWYKISLKAAKEINKLEKNLKLLEDQSIQYSSDIKISENVFSKEVVNRDALRRQKFVAYKNKLESSLYVHHEIEKKAHIFMHEIYINRQYKKWDKVLDYWDEETVRAEEAALALGEEVKWLQKFGSELEDFEDFMDSENVTDVDEELRLDIEKATAKLKVLLD